MKHRDAADTKRYKVLSKKFIEKFGIDTSTYDVIKGWRANASYFYIAKEFVRDNVDTDILEEDVYKRQGACSCPSASGSTPTSAGGPSGCSASCV